jgi:hypothetical protein
METLAEISIEVLKRTQEKEVKLEQVKLLFTCSFIQK